MAEEICHLASIDSDYGASELSETELLHLYHTFSLVMEDVDVYKRQDIILS